MVRQFLYRWTAFSFFVCAAFAWIPPFIDRAGLAAFGFGFLALSLGRAWGVARPGILPGALPPFMLPTTADSDAGDSLVARVGAYAEDNGQ